MDNKKDNKEMFLYRKSEKICSALHLMTSFFDRKEPLKMSLRESAINLVSYAVSFNKQNDLASTIDLFDCEIAKIKSFLETAVFSGLVSKMNHAILREELNKVLDVLETKKKESFGLPSAFLEIEKDELKEIKELKPQPEPLKNQGQVLVLKDKTSSRKDTILDLLRQGQELTIKDFADSIKDCSEKTIQRELIRLVSTGIIEKKGERRWSRYKLTLSH